MRMSKLLFLAGLMSAVPMFFGQDMIWRSPSPNQSEAKALLQAVCPSGIHLNPPACALWLQATPEIHYGWRASRIHGNVRSPIRQLWQFHCTGR